MATQTKKAVEVAQLHAQTLPNEMRLSLPIPIRKEGQLHFLFLLCNAVLKFGEGQYVYPPTYLMRVNADSGTFDSLIETSPKRLGVPAVEDKALGLLKPPLGMTGLQLLEKLNRLYVLYDQLLPPFAARQPSSQGGMREVALEFRQLFSLLSEPMLLPFYRHLGAEFFSWVEQISR